MDLSHLLNAFLPGLKDKQIQPSGLEQPKDTRQEWTNTVKNIAQQATQGPMGGFAGGAVAGGLLSLLLTSKKVQSIAGGVVGYGGAAALGALALKAYQNYQASQANGNIASAKEDLAPSQLAASNPLDTTPAFSLVLIKSMIMAAKADGHIDAPEQQRVFSALENSSLSSEEKAIVLDALSRPINLQDITKNIANLEQAGQVYMASRIAIDPDQPAEKEHLVNLANALKLPKELVLQLESQIPQQ